MGLPSETRLRKILLLEGFGNFMNNPTLKVFVALTPGSTKEQTFWKQV